MRCVCVLQYQIAIARFTHSMLRFLACVMAFPTVEGFGCGGRADACSVRRAAVGSPHLRPSVLRCSSAGDDEDGGILDSFVSKADNPYVTSKADRMRAKYGEQAVTGSSKPRGIVEDRLAADLQQFKAERGLAGKALAGGQNYDESTEDLPIVKRIINVLGTVLTYNFFIIIGFFTWFMAGVAGQYGFENTDIIGSFRACWDWLIMPLLTTHMTLTFLSAGLERLAASEDTA